MHLLWYTEKASLWMKIYAPLRGLSTTAKELMAASHVMQSSSYDLSILVSRKAKSKQMEVTT